MRGLCPRLRTMATIAVTALLALALVGVAPAGAAVATRIQASVPVASGQDPRPETLELAVIQVVGGLITLVLLAVLLGLDLKYVRASRRIAKEMNLPKGQWLRLVKTLPFDPVIELVAVGLLVVSDMIQNWEHLVAGIVGAALGVWVGHFRYRIQYVRAVPESKAIVFVRSRAEYVALAILFLVDFASEQHQIPVVGPLTLLVTLGLTLILSESIARSWFSYRRYRTDAAVAAA